MTSRVSVAHVADQRVSRIVVNQGGAGSVTLKAAQLNKRHKLIGAILTLSADGTLKFQSAANDLCGPMDIASKGGFVYDSDSSFFECNANEDLNLVTTGGAAKGVVLVLTEA